MSKERPTDQQDSRPTLRERAEVALRTLRTDLATMPAEDIQALVHELQVRQIGLEMHNEELRQAQLTEPRDLYADLYEFAPVGYLMLDDQGVIVEANLSAATLLGTQRDALLKAKITDFIAHDAQDAFYLHQQLMSEDGAKHVCEIKMHTSDGTPMVVRLESVMHAQTPHAQAFCRTAMIDVTAHQKGEDELRTLNYQLDMRIRDRTAEMFQTFGDLQEEVTARRESEERLRREIQLTEGLDDTAQAVILMLDREGKILRFNPYMERLSDYTSDEMWGRDWFDAFLPPGIRTETRELFLDAIDGERVSRNVTPMITKSGQERQIEWSDAALTDRDGSVIGLVCTGHDVTERIELETKLRETTEHLQAILSTAVDAIVTIDPRGRIVSVNPATRRMFGYTEEELVGQNVSILMGSPDRENHNDYIANYLRTGEAKIIGIGREVLARRKDGSAFPIDLAISRFRDRNGTAFTGIMRDISKRKELEQHMAESREQERRHLSQEIHDGVGGLMTGIGLLAKLLQTNLEREESAYAEPAAELLGHIREAHEQLRNISRGLQPVEVTTDGLQAALRQLAVSASLKGGPACVFRSHGDIGVYSQAHAVHLYRIAQEAISNALRHGQAEHITIDLDAGLDQLRLTVRDDGIGIQHSPDSTEGMGLRTMQYRAEQIGAKLTIGPAADGGSVVTCEYPNTVRYE